MKQGLGLILAILMFSLSSSGCMVMKSTHQKEMNKLKAEISDLEDNLTSLDKNLAVEKAKSQTLESNLNSTNTNLLSATREGSQTKEQLRQSQRETAACQRELAMLEAKKGKLSNDLQAALDRVAKLEKVAAEREQIFKNLLVSLKGMLDAGTAKVSIIRGMLTVQLAEKVLFDLNKADLKPEGMRAITELTGIIRDLQGRRWQIAGHTDSTGPAELNWRLSSQRALSVILFMISQGMPPEQLSAAGFGQYAPVADNDTSENRGLNRRIEVILVPNLEELELMGVGKTE
jgi:chemotaxis protein MotB